MNISNKKGDTIGSVEDWYKYAPPKQGQRHWKDYRSAKELAKSWFRTGSPAIPCELKTLFNKKPELRDLGVQDVVAELPIHLDKFRGETRNTDLLLVGHVANLTTVVTIEGKADEPFGMIVADYLKKVEKAGKRSNLPDRIKILFESLFRCATAPELRQLRYQLIHAMAATLIEAKKRNARQAGFVIHEFLSKSTNPKNVARNAADFEAFRSLFGRANANNEAPYESWTGPIYVPGGEFVPCNIPIFIGKVSIQLP